MFRGGNYRASVAETVLFDYRKIFEPQHEKTNNVVSDQVEHKPRCASTEDGYRPEILD